MNYFSTKCDNILFFGVFSMFVRPQWSRYGVKIAKIYLSICKLKLSCDTSHKPEGLILTPGSFNIVKTNREVKSARIPVDVTVFLP